MHAIAVFALLALAPFASLVAQEERLAPFVGEWFGDVTYHTPRVQGLLLIGQVSIEQPNPGTISTQFSQSGESFRLTLQYDPTQQSYLLTYESDLFPPFEGLLLTYSEEKGFSGRGEIAVRGVSKTLEATIEPHPEAGYKGSIWKIVVRDNESEEYYNKVSFSRKEG